MDFQALRKEYTLAGLHESDLAADPIDQFRTWFEQAIAAGIEGPEAMTLATADPEGRPAARIVLLKDFSPAGFVFFTNYDSVKAAELAANPRVELLFFWKELERQVRINGRAERVGREISEQYFHSRPRGSQVGAWASKQSSVVSGREELEAKYGEFDALYAQGEVPLPEFWGGYCVVPEYFEFWQGRENRLHDRLRYRQTREAAGWVIERLSP